MHESKNLSKTQLGENWYFLKPRLPHLSEEKVYIYVA